jgi:hypothetical protein
MSAAQFQSLLDDFYHVKERKGRHKFELFAYTPDEAARLSDIEWDDVGVVQLGENVCWHVAARHTKELNECTILFRKLAARGGPMVPESILSKLAEQDDPISYWLAFLWWHFSRSEEVLQIDESQGEGKRRVFPRLFRSSISAIRLEGLTDPNSAVYVNTSESQIAQILITEVASQSSQVGEIVADRVEIIAKMPNVVRAAFLAYETAANRHPGKVSDRAAYDWAKENVREDCRFPTFETFATYLRRARRLLGEQKNRPRRGRVGRSIVDVKGRDSRQSLRDRTRNGHIMD